MGATPRSNQPARMSTTPPTTPPEADFLLGSAGTELASQRTGLAFERTRMAVERTLMASLRTSLALIGFGFTIVKFFREVGNQLSIESAMVTPARNFGITLVAMGVGLLVASLIAHWQSLAALRQSQAELLEKGLFRTPPGARASATAYVAVLLLLAGLLVLLGILARTGPFG